jgi:hypothetical protein
LSLSAKQQLSRTLAADYDAWLAGQSVPSALYAAPEVVKDMRVLVAAPRPVKVAKVKPVKIPRPVKVKVIKPPRVKVAKIVRPKPAPKVAYHDGRQVAALLLTAQVLRDGAIDSRSLLRSLTDFTAMTEDSARHFIGRWIKKGVLIEHPYSACRGGGRVIALAENVGTIAAAAELTGHRDGSDFFRDWLALIGQDWARATQLPHKSTLQVLVKTLKQMVARGLLESAYRPNNRNQIVMHYRLARV